jgi:flagellar hook-associated protein 1 FlgK
MDLRDQRSRLLERLSELAPVRVNEAPDGTVRVHLSGRTLVDATHVRRLEPTAVLRSGRVMHDLLIDGEGSPIEIEGGALGTLMDMRDATIPGYLADLDRFVRELAGAVNAVHSQGTSGVAFFTGSTALDLEVNTILVADPTGVETFPSGALGGNDLALAIAGLQDSHVAGLDGRTFSSFYRDLVVGIGGDVAGARFGLEAREASLEQVRTQKDQVEAVSLDEEMANMIEAEHAYEAAARLMTTSAEMLETLLSIV